MQIIFSSRIFLWFDIETALEVARRFLKRHRFSVADCLLLWFPA